MCGEELYKEVENCPLIPCQCVVDLSKINDKLNYDVIPEGIWIEKDNITGRSSPSEYVADGQVVEEEVTIQVKCASCKCKGDDFKCVKNDACGEYNHY